MVRIEVHDNDDDVLAGRVDLAVADELFVLDLVKAHVLEPLECRVLAADPVDAGDEGRERMGLVELPVAHLVLLRVEVLLAARLTRLGDAELERGPVDAV